jgi:hypothetical protein
MTDKTLPREPWRGSMICGYQTEVTTWSSRAAYCGERKADGLPYCDEHYDDVRMEFGEVVMAEGNALGHSKWAMRLLWEPYEGEDPAEPSYDEMVRYAAILTD